MTDPTVPDDPEDPDVHDEEAALARARMVTAVRGRLPDLSPAVVTALERVPRHRFLPGVDLDEAHADRPVVALRRDGHVLATVSQPTMVAMMLDVAALEPGLRVLEVGAGRGYHAALMGVMVSPGGRVVTVDVEEELTAFATAAVDDLGLSDVVAVRTGDGRAGWAADGPYDRIVATAEASEVPDAWVDQLVVGGLLVAPLADPRAVVVSVRTPEGLEERDRLPARFIPLRDPG